MKSIVAILVLAGISFSSFAQQDPLYNQYQFNQLMINPAYAGIYQRVSLSLISRRQWVGIEGAPWTTTLSGSTSFWRGRSGAGLTIVRDKFGVTNNYDIQGAYSYILKLTNFKLSMGVQAGISRFDNNYNKLTLDHPDDIYLNPPDETFTRPNFGAGIMALSEYYFIGISVPRILNIETETGEIESSRYKKHYYLTGGVVLAPNNTLKFKLTGLLRYVDNTPLSFEAFGSVLLKEVVWAGISLRNTDAAGIFTLIEIGDALRAGYSFEIPISDGMTRLQFTTHEVSLGLDLSFLSGQLLTRRYF